VCVCVYAFIRVCIGENEKPTQSISILDLL